MKASVRKRSHLIAWVLVWGLNVTSLITLHPYALRRPASSAKAAEVKKKALSVRSDSKATATTGLPILTSFSREPDPATKLRVSEAYGKLPLSFEANRGQLDPAVKFHSRGSSYSLFLTSTEAVLALSKPSASTARKEPRRTQRAAHTAKPQRAVLRMKLVGAKPVAASCRARRVAWKEQLLHWQRS